MAEKHRNKSAWTDKINIVHNGVIFYYASLSINNKRWENSFELIFEICCDFQVPFDSNRIKISSYKGNYKYK